MHLPYRVLALLALCAAVLIGSSACGNSGSSGGSTVTSGASTPQIGSTPITTAVQGSAYSYTLAATDPSGGTVNFALTTAPTGATLSGNIITWTPTAAQSRTVNNFTVTATTSGGSTTQSWTVTPNGTIQVTDVITNWGPAGASTLPTISWSESYPAASVLVPQADGLMVAIYGSGDSSGVLSFQNVPAGYFWLNINGIYYWTSSSNIDFGTDQSEANTVAPSLPNGVSSTVLSLNLTGLDATANPSLLDFGTVPNSIGVQATVQDETSFSWNSSPTSSSTTSSSGEIVNIQVDVSQIQNGFVLQEEPTYLGPLAGYILGPTATLSSLSLQNNATNTINATLSPGPQASLPLKIDASEWTSLFSKVAPTEPTQTSSPFSLRVQPYAIGVNAPSATAGITSEWAICNSTSCTSAPTITTFSGPLPLGLFWPAPVATTTSNFLLAPLLGPLSCSSGLSSTVTYTCGSPSTCSGFNESESAPATPLLSSDTDFGTIQYSDPFPAAWQRVFDFCQQATLSLPSLTTTSSIGDQQTETVTWNYNLLNSQSTAAPNSPVVPVLSAVVGPTINGASFFSPATLSTRAITLNWSKPVLGTPYGYRVLAVALPQANSSTGIVIGTISKSLYTAQTSLTIPPELLTSGQTYLFDITALVDAKANVETSPRRSGLPTAAANVVSAPIVISASAP